MFEFYCGCFVEWMLSVVMVFVVVFGGVFVVCVCESGVIEVYDGEWWCVVCVLGSVDVVMSVLVWCEVFVDDDGVMMWDEEVVVVVMKKEE